MPKAKQALCLLLALVLAMAFFACAPAGGAAAPDEAVTIRLAAPQNGNILDFETNAYKLWLEEQTGLKLEMTWLPQEDAGQIVHQQLLSGDGLPDAYIGFGSSDVFGNSNLEAYAARSTVIALDTLIEAHGENLNSLFEELPEYSIRPLMTAADGHFYYMPGFSSSLITRYRQVMWVNKGWLDTLGLPVPATTEDFRGMLLAFRDGDPNGNGLQDEIPLAGTEATYAKQVYDFLFNAFIYNNEKNARLLLEDGAIGFAPVQDEWREALQYMRGLYDEGLISPLSFTQDDQQLAQMANDPRDILGAFASPGITLTVLQNSPEMMERYVGIGPLAGPKGVQLASVSIPLPKPNGVITSACRHPEAVFRLFDLMLSEEACLMGRYGEQGVDWNFAPAGAVSIYGTPATIEIIHQLWNTPQNKHLMQIGPYVSRPQYSGGVTWSGSTTDGEYMNAQAALLYQAYEPEEFVGVLIYTSEEEAQIQDIRAGIEAHVRQAAIHFITGARDITDDAAWQSHIAEYDALGLQTFLAVAQAACDRSR
ncbi:MAG: extracellular solute-binding protein [Ruminococcaceae bacterium]|nr:extracellular solute-binding protein [Oscillospiraceae bacterium]